MTTAPDAFHHEIADRHDKVLIVDFGSQVTQLIARRVREAGVYCEIAPFQKRRARLRARCGRRRSSSPAVRARCTEEGSPRAPQAIFDSGVPVLGICYGQQTMAAQLGGEVEGGHHREFGRAEVEVRQTSALFDGVWETGERYPVWMSHGDRVTELPPGFRVIAGVARTRPSRRSPTRARRYYGVQFHPEVVHTPDGAKLISQFRAQGRGPAIGDWTMARLPRRGDRSDPRAGRQRAGDLRPVGRRRFRGRRGADPRGDRRRSSPASSSITA